MRAPIGILVFVFLALVALVGCDDAVSPKDGSVDLCARPVLPTLPSDCIDLRHYIHTTGVLNTAGDAKAVAIAGSYACVADGDGGVVVVDACDPQRMQVASRWVTDARVNDVAHLESWLYVATDDGLTVLSFGDPLAPAAVASRRGAGASLGIHIDAARRRAFVTDDVIGLVIYDISAPRWPSVLGIENTPGQAMDVCVKGGTAYVADSQLGLRIASVESPENPWLIKAVPTPGQAQGVAVWRNIALVADGTAGLTVVDVSSPFDATVIAGVSTASVATAVAARAGYAYVTDSSDGLLVFDLVDPASPTLVARSSGEGLAGGVTVFDDIAFVADGVAGLRAVDVRSSSSAPVLDRLQLPTGNAAAVVAIDNRFYVADENLGVIVGEWRGDAFFRRGDVLVGGSPQRMTLYEGALYVCADAAGVRQVNVDDPDNPVLVGEIPGTAGALDVAFSDSIAITVRGGRALPNMVDLRRPNDPPVALGITGGIVRAVDVGTSFAYFVQVQGRLWVSSLDLGSSQLVKGVQPTNGNSTDVHVRADSLSGKETLFVSNRRGFTDPTTGIDFSAGVEVYDLSDPLLPAFVALIETSVPAERIAFAGDIMFVAGERDGFEVFDVSDPLAATAIGAYWQPDPIRDAVAVPGAILLSAGSGGLIALPPACD